MNKQNRADQRKYHYIYKTTNLINQKYYVGMHSTNNLDDGYIGSGTRLWRSIQHYRRENFNVEILEFLPDRKSLKEREAEIVNLVLLKDPLCMNICTGGYGGWEVYNSNGELQRQKCLRGNSKMSWLRQNDSAWRLQESERKRKITIKAHSDGKMNIEAFRNAFKGKAHSDETRKLIGEKNSVKQLGSGNSQFGTKWIYSSVERRSRKISKKQEVPEGWTLGRKMFSVQLGMNEGS